MKLVTFSAAGRTQHGVFDEAEDTIVVLGDGDLSAVVAAGSAPQPPIATAERISRERVTLLAPLLSPGKLICAAANYQEHVTESGSEERDERTATPRLFLKPNTSLCGQDAELRTHPITSQLDWEVELAVIIGKGGRDIPRERALDHVFGYATSNDISARNLELGARDGEAWTGFFDWLEGKWLDNSAPVGPFLVTADEVPDPHELPLRLSVNGVLHQSSTTAGMIHRVDELIAFSSRLMTLNPGDIILTGTPAGVGATTGTFLSPGDEMVAEVVGLGQLRTHVVAGDHPA